MQTTISNKRRRIKIRRFLELIVLPIMISGLLLLIGLIVAVAFFHVQFVSERRMIVIMVIIILVLGEVIFEISRAIIKHIMKR